MAVASKIGDWVFKAFTAGLGVATIYMTGTFSVNVYRGLAWHNAEKKAAIEGILQKAATESILQKPEQGSTDQSPQ